MNYLPERSDLVAGPADALAAMVTNYQCGHCNGQIERLTTDDTTGVMHAFVQHEDSCPVLAGTLPTIPDTFRAIRGQS
ncbi:hypothetical protein ACFW9O_19080 [Streptomyces sp. NPDC059499]|uniref:hypothetical protein n=1 Tax=Streptomyces sp. NPDC059499 TaxID=3346852 RepID=UPI0036C5E5D3